MISYGRGLIARRGSCLTWGRERTQGPPSSASSFPTVSSPQVPPERPRRSQTPGQPLGAPGAVTAAPRPRAPPACPGPRTLLFTSMVPRQPLPAPCRWPRFILRPGPRRPPPAGPPLGGARGECAAGGLGARRRRRPGLLLTGTCRKCWHLCQYWCRNTTKATRSAYLTCSTCLKYNPGILIHIVPRHFKLLNGPFKV